MWWGVGVGESEESECHKAFGSVTELKKSQVILIRVCALWYIQLFIPLIQLRKVEPGGQSCPGGQGQGCAFEGLGEGGGGQEGKKAKQEGKS